MDLSEIKGIGQKKKEVLAKLGIQTVEDLYTFLPRRYEDRSVRTFVSDLKEGMKLYLKLKVETAPKTSFYAKNKTITRLKASDETGTINIIWYNDRFTAQKIIPNNEYKFFGIYDFQKKALINPIISKIEEDLIGGITPIYSFKKGVSSKEIIKLKDKLFDLDFSLREFIDSYLLERFNIKEINQMYLSLHRPISNLDLYNALFSYNLRNLIIEKISNKKYLENYNKNFIKFENKKLDDLLLKIDFELTSSQQKALEGIISDMVSKKRMNRILIGDVGSGKTVVAILAAYMAILNNYQVAFMAPTEILAIQHFSKYRDILESLGVKSELLLGSTPQKLKNEINNSLKENKISIIFGTHSLFQDKVEFSKLGLVITDEQQRFGVFQRKSLSDKGDFPDNLILSATPIPRTLALSLYSSLDISFIDTLPKNRLPIKSYLQTIYQEKKFIDFAYSRIQRGEQVYIVVTRVEEEENLESVESIYRKLSKYFNDKVKIDILHGQMHAIEKEEKQRLFFEKKIDLLIATSIVEVGLDNPNATVMIIYDANQFGMSQLHQIRGRVGRSALQSYCFFVVQNKNQFSEKLEFIVNNLNGFEISKKDLELRGSGSFLGTNQSGFIEIEDSMIVNEDLIETSNRLIELLDLESDQINQVIEERVNDLNKIILN